MKLQKNSSRFVLFLIILGMLSALVLTGCVGTGTKSPKPGDPAEKLIYDAEKASENKNFEKALENYTRFIKEYPEHPSLPKVLLRMGSLYNDTEEYEKAYLTFSELVRKYPKTPEYDAACLGICKSFYGSGKKEEAFGCIEKTRIYLREPQSRTNLAILYAEFLAKADKGLEAANSLEDALKEIPEAYHPQILDAFLSIAKLMDPGDIEALIPEAQWPEPAATISLAWGLQLVEAGRYRKAEKALQIFLATFPNHKKSPMVKDLIVSIKDKPEIDTFALGGLLPLSGRFAALGNQALRGVEVATALYGERPGALPIRVRIEDTLSDDPATIAALERLNENLVLAAIGPIGSSLEAIHSSAQSGLPLITFTQQDGVTDTGSNVFRNFLTPAMQVDCLVSYLMGTLGLSRFAILYPQDSYGEHFRDLFWDKVTEAGGEITGIEGYPPQSSDFSESIRKLVGVHPLYRRLPVFPEEKVPPLIQFEAIFIPDSADRAGMILPQLAYHDVEKVQVVGTNLWHSPKLLEVARRHAIGAIMPSGFFPESTRPEVQQFMAKYLESYETPPGYLEAVVFDSMMLLFHALEQSPYSRNNLKQLLLTMPPFPGVTGNIQFSETREAVTRPYLLKVTSLGFTEITP
ncbi:ABC transporter substrate-binding protein [Desulfococcaceae bacterium OttesenSCG-928-F15]|nr:ABC transporter substrate-binding protein [Desulfococcaceae bacterium OttesenSCG-928-F15]